MAMTAQITDCQKLLRESAPGVTLVVLAQPGAVEARSSLVQVGPSSAVQAWTEEEPTWEDAAWV